MFLPLAGADRRGNYHIKDALHGGRLIAGISHGCDNEVSQGIIANASSNSCYESRKDVAPAQVARPIAGAN
jgi:hypothetical protein